MANHAVIFKSIKKRSMACHAVIFKSINKRSMACNAGILGRKKNTAMLATLFFIVLKNASWLATL